MSNKQKNLLLLTLFTLVCVTSLVFRFGQLMLVKNVNDVNLQDYVADHSQRSSITEARRGTIFDRNGVPIAMDTTSYSMFAVLRSDWDDNEVNDPDYTAKVLAEKLGANRDEILNYLTQPQVNQVELGVYGKQISAAVKDEIEQANLPGIIFVSDSTRQYINDMYASQLIGYAEPIEKEKDMMAGILEGKLGIEQAYNDVLSGYHDAEEAAVIGSTLIGKDIYLTLDSRLQNKLEDLMTSYENQYQPLAMNAYLVDISDGQLLAASQRPSFNLNTRDGIDKEWKNLMVGEAYEPGSTIKILTTAVAYDEKVFKADETFKSGQIKVYDQTVKDHNEVGWGEISFEEGFIRSSNVAMVNLVNRLGDQNWINKLAQFGFGQFPQSGLFNEVKGNFVFDNPVTRVMTGFGQGLSATPLQLMQAYISIAHQGQMLKIQFVKGTESQTKVDPIYMGQPISANAAQFVLDLMIKAVNNPNGTAVNFKNSHVQVAAKTGTAQIASETGQGYLTGPDDYYHSVIAFFPAEQPKYMMYIAMKQFQNDQMRTGTQIIANFFNEFVDYLYVAADQ